MNTKVYYRLAIARWYHSVSRCESRWIVYDIYDAKKENLTKK